MKRNVLGCTVLSIVALLSIFVIMAVFLHPLADCGPQLTRYVSSTSVMGSKINNVFICEYEPLEVKYKDTSIKIASAFLEYLHYLDDNDSIVIKPDAAKLQIWFDDYRPLKHQGYKNEWLINDYLNLSESGHITINYYDGELPPDTLSFYIRECHPFLDSLNHEPTCIELNTLFKWDTIQCINLVRK